MNKTKRTFLLLLAAIMAASAFTACGGEEKNTESTASAILEGNSAQTAEMPMLMITVFSLESTVRMTLLRKWCICLKINSLESA